MCETGSSIQACNNDEPPDCRNVKVWCDFTSNELFDTEGAVPSEYLEEREWCGAAENADESGGAGNFEVPVGSVYRVDLDPTETSILAEWVSRTWGSNSLTGTGDGQAEYRIEACPTGGGSCIYLYRLVIYGGDIEVNGIEVSNLIAKLATPVWLPYGSNFEVDVGVAALPMLVTYKIDDVYIAWEARNSNVSGGTINPSTDVFVLDTLEFSGSQGDIGVVVELEVGGTHL